MENLQGYPLHQLIVEQSSHFSLLTRFIALIVLKSLLRMKVHCLMNIRHCFFITLNSVFWCFKTNLLVRSLGIQMLNKVVSLLIGIFELFNCIWIYACSKRFKVQPGKKNQRQSSSPNIFMICLIGCFKKRIKKFLLSYSDIENQHLFDFSFVQEIFLQLVSPSSFDKQLWLISYNLFYLWNYLSSGYLYRYIHQGDKVENLRNYLLWKFKCQMADPNIQILFIQEYLVEYHKGVS